ncbi:MAG: GNAT family N-acetyltransferase [Chloroflexota bacterium]
MADITLRPATRADDAAIKALIRSSQINPMDLDWRRFLLAVTRDGEMVGCGQVKPHSDGTRELASIAVRPAWRGRGIARLIIERLLDESPRPLYLTCASGLGPLYEKFGFRALSEREMTPYFRRLSRLATAFMKLARGQTLLVMKLD